MEINLIVNDGGHTAAWHINPTECEFVVNMRDGSLTIKPKDSAWIEVQWGLDVATDEQIDPTRDPWPQILQQVAEREAAANAAREAATKATAGG